jgi:hypothetical protein
MMKIELNLVRPNAWNTNVMSESVRKTIKRRMIAGGPESTPPIIVRKVGEAYEIVDGEQRWRIARELGWKHMDAIVLDLTDLEAKKMCFSLNKNRGWQNWFKLSDEMVKDQQAGVNIYAIYGDVFTNDQILSLRMVTAKVRNALEKILAERSIPLDYLHIITALLPDHQEEILDTILSDIRAEDVAETVRFHIEQVKRGVR